MPGEHVNYKVIFLIIGIIGGIYFVVVMLKRHLRTIYRLFGLMCAPSIEITGDSMINKFVEYMTHYQQFYTYTQKIVLNDMLIVYAKMTHDIYFTDTTYGVTGIVNFVNDTTSSTPPSVSVPSASSTSQASEFGIDVGIFEFGFFISICRCGSVWLQVHLRHRVLNPLPLRRPMNRKLCRYG